MHIMTLGPLGLFHQLSASPGQLISSDDFLCKLNSLLPRKLTNSQGPGGSHYSASHRKDHGVFWGFCFFFPLGYPFDPAPLIVKTLPLLKGLFELLVQIPTLGRRPSMLGWGGEPRRWVTLLQLCWPGRVRWSCRGNQKGGRQ